MVTRWCVKQPQELTIPKFDKDSGVAAWNWVGNDASHRVQRLVVHTEAPDKFVDVADMFLMRFGGQNALKQPAPIVNLTDVAHLLEASDCLAHDREFLQAISDILDGNGRCITSVGDARIVPDGHPYSALVEYRPVLLDKGINSGLKSIIKMGQVQLLVAACTVNSFIKWEIK